MLRSGSLALLAEQTGSKETQFSSVEINDGANTPRRLRLKSGTEFNEASKVGEGNQGEVFEAENELGKKVVVKLSKPDKNGETFSGMVKGGIARKAVTRILEAAKVAGYIKDLRLVPALDITISQKTSNIPRLALSMPEMKRNPNLDYNSENIYGVPYIHDEVFLNNAYYLMCMGVMPQDVIGFDGDPLPNFQDFKQKPLDEKQDYISFFRRHNILADDENNLYMGDIDLFFVMPHASDWVKQIFKQVETEILEPNNIENVNALKAGRRTFYRLKAGH